MATPRSLVRSLQRLPLSSYKTISQTSRPALSACSRIRTNSPFICRSSVRAPLLRQFSTTPQRPHGHVHEPKPGEELYVTFVDKEGNEHKIAVAPGDNLLDIAQAHDLEMEGACGGSCACSTCHVIIADEDYYDKMPEPEDDENDMLDLAFGLTETSRLGCQVVMTKELDGLTVKLPSMTRNLQASDFGSKS
ncbi:ferredoxin [Hypoxylon fuscum]|nr:ferredoxin [Hypoxylon fuscum]